MMSGIRAVELCLVLLVVWSSRWCSSAAKRHLSTKFAVVAGGCDNGEENVRPLDAFEASCCSRQT